MQILFKKKQKLDTGKANIFQGRYIYPYSKILKLAKKIHCKRKEKKMRIIYNKKQKKKNCMNKKIQKKKNKC